MIRLTLFISALLLAVDATQLSDPWLVAIAVLSGIAMLTTRGELPRGANIAIFVISLLLLTESIDWSDGWFIAMAVLSGLALFARPVQRLDRVRRWRRRWREWFGDDWPFGWD